MGESSTLRVALLARAGDAREQLKRAITELGGTLVVEADPNDLAAGDLAAAGATTVLVSVEPAVEAALDRLDDEFLGAHLNVMFDEAETTSKLTGWDQARWARHVAAKLLGRDVLPPGFAEESHQEAASHLVPGSPSMGSTPSEANIGDYADEINDSARDVPSAYSPSDAQATDKEGDIDAVLPTPPASWATPPVVEGDPDSLGLDFGALQSAMTVSEDDARIERDSPAIREIESSSVAPFDFDDAIDLSGLEMIDDPADAPPPPRPTTSSVSLLSAKEIDLGKSFDAGDLGMDVEEITLTEDELAAFGDGDGGGFGFGHKDDAPSAIEDESGSDLEMDPELARLAASLDERLDAEADASSTFESEDDFDLSFSGASDADDDLVDEPVRDQPVPPRAPDFDFAEGDFVDKTPKVTNAVPDTSHLILSAEDAPPLPPAEIAKPDFDFSALAGLELAPMDDLPAVAPVVEASVVAAPEPDVGHLSLSPLAETGDGPAEAVGTVLVLSGIGGPDAVRQMLRALPANFPLAVLLSQNLDGGRHDRFVEQLAKISRLPVALSEPTETPPARCVRVLPDGASSAGALSFPRNGGVAALIAATTARDGAVVVLSGADEAAIEPLREALAAGVRVLVQDPSSCFDGKVAGALAESGAASLPASDLALRLDAYFPA